MASFCFSFLGAFAFWAAILLQKPAGVISILIAAITSAASWYAAQVGQEAETRRKEARNGKE
jgi:hypothetical protein